MEDRLIPELIEAMLKEQVSEMERQGKSEQEIRLWLEEFDKHPFYENTAPIPPELFLPMIGIIKKRVIKDYRKDKHFLARHWDIWGEAFHLYDSMYLIAVEAGSAYSRFLVELPQESLNDKFQRLIVLREIHARVCQIYLEIGCLIQNGFADGAYARWRTMYELGVYAAFIRDNDEKVAQAYHEASKTENPTTTQWAKVADCFKRKEGYITFKMIQDKTDIATPEWRKQYGLSNMIVHGTPQGTFKRLSDRPNDTLSAGRSIYGIALPAEHAAASLAFISAVLFTLKPCPESLIAAKILDEWIDLIRTKFLGIQQHLNLVK